MDKQTAIDLLDNLLGMVEDNHDSDYDTAIKMGIDALKMQLSKKDATKDATFDCISRQQTIGALDALCDRECEYSKQQRGFMCGACRLGSAFDVIEELPSVQPQSKREWYQKGYRDGQEKWWRPVSILPDETEVLISHRGAVWEDYATFDDDGQHILMGSGVDADSIDAWMPLPEPYTSGADMRGTE